MSIVSFRVILTFQCATHDGKSGYWHWNVRSTFNRHNMFDLTLQGIIQLRTDNSEV